jgi:hypothetical protein
MCCSLMIMSAGWSNIFKFCQWWHSWNGQNLVICNRVVKYGEDVTPMMYLNDLQFEQNQPKLENIDHGGKPLVRVSHKNLQYVL